MRNWFRSLNGALSLAVAGFLGAVAYLNLHTASEGGVEGFFRLNQPGLATLGTLFWMAYLGAWMWSVVAAARGSRSGLKATLFFSVMLFLGWSLGDVLLFCPFPCTAFRPLWDIVNGINFVLGLAASIALWFQIQQPAQGATSH